VDVSCLLTVCPSTMERMATKTETRVSGENRDERSACFSGRLGCFDKRDETSPLALGTWLTTARLNQSIQNYKPRQLLIIHRMVISFLFFFFLKMWPSQVIMAIKAPKKDFRGFNVFFLGLICNCWNCHYNCDGHIFISFNLYFRSSHHSHSKCDNIVDRPTHKI